MKRIFSLMVMVLFSAVMAACDGGDKTSSQGTGVTEKESDGSVKKIYTYMFKVTK